MCSRLLLWGLTILLSLCISWGCIENNDTKHSNIDIGVLLDLRPNILDNDVNSITYELSKAFLFGGIESSWTCAYGKSNLRFCLFGYTDVNTYILEDCTNNAKFLLNFYLSHNYNNNSNNNNTTAIDILDYLSNSNSSNQLLSSLNNSANTIEDSIISIIDYLDSFNDDTNNNGKRLIITMFGNDVINNSINENVCNSNNKNKRPLNCQIELLQAYHILIHFSNNDTESSQSTYKSIKCLNSNNLFNQYNINKENYYLANISQIVDSNYFEFNSTMYEITNNFVALYESNENNSNISSFNDISSCIMPMTIASCAYGQFDETIFLISGNVTFKNINNSNDNYFSTTEYRRRGMETMEMENIESREITRNHRNEKRNNNNRINILRRRLLARKTSTSSVSINTKTSDVTIISDSTSSNTEITSASSSTTNSYVSYPGSFYQFNIETFDIIERADPPIDGIIDPCVVSDGIRYVYLIGGYYQNTNKPSKITQRYDQTRNKWTVLPEMKVERYMHTCHYYPSNAIIVFGGCNSDDINNCKELPSSSNNGYYLTSIEYLDLNGNNQKNAFTYGWRILNGINLNIARVAARSVTDLDFNIWIIGGYNGTHTLKSIEIFSAMYNDKTDVLTLTKSSINDNDNYKMIIGRAGMAVSQTSFDQSDASCIAIYGGRFGDNVANYDELTVLDNIEYQCYNTPYFYDRIEECNNNPCDCNEVKNCKICHYPNGCDQCIDGYFKKDYNFHCVQCQQVFGYDCMHCTDFLGCQQCQNGIRTFDQEAGLWYCQ